MSNKSTKKNKCSDDFVFSPRTGAEICFCRNVFLIISSIAEDREEESGEDGEGQRWVLHLWLCLQRPFTEEKE